MIIGKIGETKCSNCGKVLRIFIDEKRNKIVEKCNCVVVVKKEDVKKEETEVKKENKKIKKSSKKV